MKRYILLLFLIAGFVHGQAGNQAVYKRDSLTVFTTPTQVNSLLSFKMAYSDTTLLIPTKPFLTLNYYLKTQLDNGALDGRYYTESETNTLLSAKFNTADFATSFNSSFSGKTTDNLTEGSTNKYYSSTLFNNDFVSKGLRQGAYLSDTTKFYLSANFNNDFDLRLSTKSLDNIAEGTTNVHLTTTLKSNYDLAYTRTSLFANDTTNWNTAYSLSHSHSNKAKLDSIAFDVNTINGITSTLISNWNTAYNNYHTHTNKSILDGTQESFTTSLKSNYDNAYLHSWQVVGGAVSSKDTLPYLIHSFTTAQRDSWTPTNGWLFRNSTLSAYQIYENGWQTLASGEWVEANYISKIDTTDYVRYATSTVGYIPYVSRTGVLSNSGIYFNGTNYGIGTTAPASTLHVQGSSGSTGGLVRFTTSDFVDGSVGSGLLVRTGTNTGNTFTSISALSSGFAEYNNLILNPNGGNVGINNIEPVDLLDIKYATGVKLTSFRGTTNTAITGWIMYNADGEACYVYPNATQDGIIVSATAP